MRGDLPFQGSAGRLDSHRDEEVVKGRRLNQAAFDQPSIVPSPEGDVPKGKGGGPGSFQPLPEEPFQAFAARRFEVLLQL
ncbi:MAG: hypothetical protein C0617_01960 [Desulfuromonas sp.]|nr:MAG: hypothetical protein C0617_01960 [Desulfuromonas sp.]